MNTQHDNKVNNLALTLVYKLSLRYQVILLLNRCMHATPAL